MENLRAATKEAALPQAKEDTGKKVNYAHRSLGYVVLALSLLGSSSVGVVQNSIPCEGSFLKNAWRF